MAIIHPTAEVDKSAELADDCEIGRNAYVGPHCIIHSKVKVGMNSIIECHTEVGEATILAPNVHIGGAPQDYSFGGEDTKLKIGSKCIIREFTTMHRASTKEDWVTEVGNGCFIMAYAHVGHDCKIGNNVTMVSSRLPGHIHVGDRAVLSGYIAIHQKVHIGTMAMVAGLSHVSLDVPPYCIISNPVKGQLMGLNVVGLTRNGVSSEARVELKRAYKIFMNKKYSLKEAIEEMKKLNQLDEVKTFISFIEEGTERGITRN